MIKAIIIEDEKPASDKLKKMLLKYSDIEVLHVLDNVSAAKVWLHEHAVDLIFLDIHLGDDVSFRIFDDFKVKSGIIFTTAYDQYALKAFKLNSIDYLLKPIQEDELDFAIEKFKNTRANTNINLENLLSTLTKKPEYQERFMVISGQKIKSVPTSSIAYLTSEGRYVKLVTDKNEQFLLDQSLESVEHKLNPDVFFRINRQIIVHINSIKAMHVWSKSRVKLELQPAPDFETIVSIDKSSEFKKWLDK